MRAVCFGVCVCEKSEQLLRQVINAGDSCQFMCVFVRMTGRKRARVRSPSLCVPEAASIFTSVLGHLAVILLHHALAQKHGEDHPEELEEIYKYKYILAANQTTLVKRV